MADLNQHLGTIWKFTEQEVFGTGEPSEQEFIGFGETSWPEFIGEEPSEPEFVSFGEVPSEQALMVTHQPLQPKVGAQLGCKSGIGLARGLFSEATLRKNPVLLLIFAGGGALLGHKLDTQVLPNYPSFRMVLEAVNSIV